MERVENIFSLVTKDPVRFNMLTLKSKLAMVLISMIRSEDLTQVEAAKRLEVSQPRVSNLFKGKLDKFSVDSLLELIMRVGYKPDFDFDPKNLKEPFRMTLKKAML